MSTQADVLIPVSDAAWKALQGAYDLQLHLVEE